MTLVQHVSRNCMASARLFKSISIRFDNDSKRSFNDRWLLPFGAKTETNDNSYHCTLYTTTTINNHRWSSLNPQVRLW